MLNPGAHDWERAVVDGPCCRVGNDSVSAADCGIHRGQTIRAMKMKKRVVILGAFAALVLFAGVYLWGPSNTPPTQMPLLTLSTANFSQFEDAFDEAVDAPRIVLLLSPT
jgi:hypothetical protein